MLLDTFYDTMLLYSQSIHVVNFSDVPRGFVNVIIMYENREGLSVKLEAIGKIDKDYVQTLDFIWKAMKRAAQEAQSDYSGPFSPLTLPAQNDLLKVLDDFETYVTLFNILISLGCRRVNQFSGLMSNQRKLLVVATFIYLEHRSFRPKGKTLKAE